MPARQEDFPEDVKTQALERANGKCERCWAERDLEFHHRLPVVLGGGDDPENCVVLCASCHQDAPSDPLIFDNVFLRFTSPKEMIRHYNAKNEMEALVRLCDDLAVDGIDAETILERMRNRTQRRTLVYEGMKKKARFGRVGGATPYGYSEVDGELVIDESKAKTVDFIFHRYLEGATSGQISKELNQGIKIAKQEKRWFKMTISRMLKNPTYCGFLRWGGEIRKGTHPPIIDVGMFNRTQEEIVRRIRRASQKYNPILLPED